MYHDVEGEEEEQHLKATKHPEEAVEPRHPPVGSVGLNEAVEQKAAREEAQHAKETVDVVRSGGDVIGCDFLDKDRGRFSRGGDVTGCDQNRR